MHKPPCSRALSHTLHGVIYCAIVTLLLAACSTDSDEQKVQAIIAAAEISAEARDTSEVLALVADDYTDAQGFDKTQLQQFLRGYFLIHPKIELVINVGPIEFETTDRARVRMEVMMLGTRRQANDATSLTGDMQAIQVEFKRQEKQWRVTRADRAPR